MKLPKLAELTGARLEGTTEDIEITGAAGLDEAGEGHVTFLANPKYTPRVNTTRASAIYLSEDAATDRQIAILRVKDPYLAYTRALRIFYPDPEFQPFIHPSAAIAPTAQLAGNVAVGAHAVIGRNVRIDEGVTIHPNVTIYDDVTIGSGSVIHSGVAVRERTVIGKRVIIHNNSVIGCDGFGYAKDEERHWLKIPQAGRVVIDDDVEIGAGTTIDRASDRSRVGRREPHRTRFEDRQPRPDRTLVYGWRGFSALRAGRTSRQFAHRQPRDSGGTSRRGGPSDNRGRRRPDCQERDESRHSPGESYLGNSRV
jgi:UDP-3-O-[3-hydroxymyristoyl] glucosamine N-acyltransferase